MRLFCILRVYYWGEKIWRMLEYFWLSFKFKSVMYPFGLEFWVLGSSIFRFRFSMKRFPFFSWSFLQETLYLIAWSRWLLMLYFSFICSTNWLFSGLNIRLLFVLLWLMGDKVITLPGLRLEMTLVWCCRWKYLISYSYRGCGDIGF